MNIYDPIREADKQFSAVILQNDTVLAKEEDTSLAQEEEIHEAVATIETPKDV